MLTLLTVALPPLDIANGNGGIPMEQIWYVVFFTQAGMIFIVIPYTIFYYGAYDSFGTFNDQDQFEAAESCQPQAWRSAVCSTVITAAISLTLIGVVWLFLGYADLDLQTFSGPLLDQTGMATITMGCSGTNALCTGSASTLTMDVTFPVYTIAVTAFLGWTLFAVFAGVGLYAVPLDLINFFRSRVTFMDKATREEFKMKLGKRAQSLHKVLRDLDEKLASREEVTAAENDKLKDILKEKDVVMSQYENFKVCEEWAQKQNVEDNACSHCLGLLAGILSIIVSIFWTLHIVLYMFWEDPVYGFLNTFLVELDKVWSFMGVTLYALFSFYLMICVLKGNSKWGLSIGCCTLPPLEVRNTLMQSFLVNSLLLALCSFSLVQFCMQAFKGYAGPNSSATVLFNVAARNLRGITVLYTNNVFVWILLCTAGLTFLVLLFCPPASLDLESRMREAIAEDEYSGGHKASEKLQSNVEIEMTTRGFNEVQRV